jgi:hypothetical protein
VADPPPPRAGRRHFTPPRRGVVLAGPDAVEPAAPAMDAPRMRGLLAEGVRRPGRSGITDVFGGAFGYDLGRPPPPPAGPRPPISQVFDLGGPPAAPAAASARVPISQVFGDP